MDASIIAAVATSLGLGGVAVAVVNTVAQRRKVGADATSVVTAAARELVDPLRRELATERAEHTAEIEQGRAKVREIRDELDRALDEAKNLRMELAAVRVELDDSWEQVARGKRRIRELENELASRRPPQ
jgi:septal ring factor EnvC (AmiA/AmiB activator)